MYHKPYIFSELTPRNNTFVYQELAERFPSLGKRGD